MPRAEKHDIRKHNRETHSPYTQSGRKSADASHEEEDEEDEYDGDVSTGHDETSINHNITFDEDGDHNMSPLNISNLSEEQVVASLTHAPRHVHFQLPNSDHERLDRSQSTTETPVRRGRNSAYVAPLPPSSPLNQSGSPLDPLAKVSEYLDTVVRPRGGECTDVEALGLSVLIQSSVNQSGMRHASPSNLSPFLRSNMSLGSNPVSSSPSPIRPMFTNRSTDIDAVMASSSGASAARTSASNTPSTSSPARTLAQNPNGSLYYQGGGSSRSRYRSPAFGSPGRNKVTFPRHFGEGKKDSSPMNGATQTPSPSDAKRRRVGEEKDSSVELASGSHPVTPNGISTPQHAPVTSTPRFGTSAPASHLLTSTPARPSPLRQSVRADSISPASSTAGNANGGSPRSGPSPSDSEGRSRASEKASEIMAGIIKDATPKVCGFYFIGMITLASWVSLDAFIVIFRILCLT
ncbi:hypothetical protein JB92DRAFT_1381499 [Gautieria morchelliformis]|nr:hypothetical protein JB92DRAFT_1381499 [Gautieria morchelliformis]